VIKRKDKKHWSRLNINSAHRKAILYFMQALLATWESLVMDTDTVLIPFPVIAQCSKGCTTFIELMVYWLMYVSDSGMQPSQNSQFRPLKRFTRV